MLLKQIHIEWGEHFIRLIKPRNIVILLLQTHTQSLFLFDIEISGRCVTKKNHIVLFF